MTASAARGVWDGLSWGTLLRTMAAAQCAGLLVAALILRDGEAAAIGIATLVGFLLLRIRGGTFGAIVLALLFADTAFFTGAAALTNLQDRAAPWATIGPGILAAISLPGLVAAVASVLRRGRTPAPSKSAGLVTFATLAVLAAIVVASIATAGGASAAGAQVLRLEVNGARYSRAELTASSRTVTVRVTNHDLFWHTFTIGELGVDLKLPVGGEREVTFTAAPGTYTYLCGVPGHGAFMRGTLTVP